MLVLSRKTNQRILIGDDIVITIISSKKDNVRVGIEAPRDVKVFREELCRNGLKETPHDRKLL